jgi:hypothetical protein
MNWIVETKKSRKYIRVVTEGVFNLEDHLEMIKDITSREFWRPGTDVLFDHRNLNFGKSDFDLMRGASENHSENDEKIGDGKAAILMKSLSDFARGRQFELLSESKVSAKLHIFTDESQAIEWLKS